MNAEVVIPLKYASLHGAVFIIGIGSIGPTLETKSSSKVTKLELKGSFLSVSVKGGPENKEESLLIPLTNVTHMVPA